MEFLPVSAAEMKERGWDAPDFVYVTGDAYVAHPSFVFQLSRGYWKTRDTGWRSSHSRIFARLWISGGSGGRALVFW